MTSSTSIVLFLKKVFFSLYATTKTFMKQPQESRQLVHFHKLPLSKCKSTKANRQLKPEPSDDDEDEDDGGVPHALMCLSVSDLLE